MLINHLKLSVVKSVNNFVLVASKAKGTMSKDCNDALVELEICKEFKAIYDANESSSINLYVKGSDETEYGSFLQLDSEDPNAAGKFVIITNHLNSAKESLDLTVGIDTTDGYSPIVVTTPTTLFLEDHI